MSIARELDELNGQRREIERATLDEAVAMVERDAALREAPVLVVAGENWHPGVIGIVAGRLKDRYARPAIVVAVSGGVGKGSGRSVSGVDLGAAIVAARDAGFLIDGGGHKMAAGLTVEPQHVPVLAEFLSAELSGACLASTEARELAFDGAVSPAGATAELCEVVARCGPYGAGNPEPLFALPSVRVSWASIAGENHVRCVLQGACGARVQGIAFRALESKLGRMLLSSAGRPLHIAASLKTDVWQGETRVQAQIRDAAAPV